MLFFKMAGDSTVTPSQLCALRWAHRTPQIASWVTRLTDSGGQITNLEFDFWRASLTWLSFGWLPVGSASQLARLSFQLARLWGHLPTVSAQLPVAAARG